MVNDDLVNPDRIGSQRLGVYVHHSLIQSKQSISHLKPGKCRPRATTIACIHVKSKDIEENWETDSLATYFAFHHRDSDAWWMDTDLAECWPIKRRMPSRQLRHRHNRHMQSVELPQNLANR